MKKTRSNKKLRLEKTTVRALQGADLAAVQGGMIPATRQSACWSACVNDC
jgi:hypothetical protein